jgi:transcription elongation factor Elf1
MSPRKDMYRIPPNQVRMFQRDNKRLANGPYDCPKCGKHQLQIVIAPKNKEVQAVCICGVNEELKYAPVFQGIDYYSRFLDNCKKKQ